jgi:glycopeptide antibiotics resistance protein
MAAIVSLEFLPGMYVPETNRLIFSAVAVALLIIASSIKVVSLKDSDEKIKTVRKSVWAVFIFYAVNLVILLFLSYGRTRTNFLNSDMNYRIYFRNYTNFIPFKAIIETFNALAHGNLRYVIIITLGNIFAFAPMAFFIPVLFKRINSFKRFAFLMMAMIISVECLQFITMTGSMDIDDFILNFSGAIIMYIIIKLKFFNKLFKRLYITA